MDQNSFNVQCPKHHLSVITSEREAETSVITQRSQYPCSQYSKLILCKIKVWECTTILILLGLISQTSVEYVRSCHFSKVLTLSLQTVCRQREAHQSSIFQKY